MALAKEVFERNVMALLGGLTGVARRLACDAADAEDLVAETVARAWEARDSLASESAFRAWIFRILHNTFVTEWRRRKACPEVAARDGDEPEEDCEQPFSIFEQMHQPFLLWFANPEREFVDKLLRQDLERALARLPENHRVVVMLADLEDLTYTEISQVLGIPVGTVRSRLARARGALQKALWRQAKDYGLRAAVPAQGAQREEST